MGNGGCDGHYWYGDMVRGIGYVLLLHQNEIQIIGNMVLHAEGPIYFNVSVEKLEIGFGFLSKLSSSTRTSPA